MLVSKRKVKRNVRLQTNKMLFSALAKFPMLKAHTNRTRRDNAGRLHEIHSKIDVQTKRGNLSRQN